MKTKRRPHEATAWLRTAVARRLAYLDTLDLDTTTTVVAPLGRSLAGGSTDPEDRTCDRCRHYVPHGSPLYVGMVRPRVTVHLVVGLCETCHAAERGCTR